jgi:hypothetical protein
VGVRNSQAVLDRQAPGGPRGGFIGRVQRAQFLEQTIPL